MECLFIPYRSLFGGASTLAGEGNVKRECPIHHGFVDSYPQKAPLCAPLCVLLLWFFVGVAAVAAVVAVRRA